ncbi:hypothetical protein VOLCADRAFT_90511 [Volvox carteri f. nagariensis]|uniref:Uncharacterized protein n=1 Tax=Volvox carteri f. nagariensis TaxID=3068 RepID=D8TUK7_VOLCA|nr:uncharacterized protein VOLCADRAFT_90511 [Volvox carteri f. nagariensis]EFJ48725.1 hypothetical protein VOLCADRAFT_90511 [Volvox carteri f. nagariensis]|eukprot:XP_002950057.1 hypothetical protein VOLCADRAFT_90511 [Volvox carteri f. nagariensis]
MGVFAHYIEAHDTDCRVHLPDRWSILREQGVSLVGAGKQATFGLSALRPSLYRDLSQRLLQFHWANLVLRFWNSIVKRPGTLCHRAFIADLELALGGVVLNAGRARS